MSPEEDRTRDAVDSKPKHYQLSYSGPPDCYYSSVDETSALPCGVASVMDPDIMKQVHFLPQSPELSQKFLFPIHFSSSVFHCSVSTVLNKDNNNDHIEMHNSRVFTILSLCCELSPTCTLKWLGRNWVQIMCNTSSACYVQGVVCHMVRRNSSAIKFDRVEIAFILALFYWLND